MIETAPLILTLRLDQESQSFFNGQRELYFPPSINLLKAHLTLFHQLPDNQFTYDILQNLEYQVFELSVTGLLNIGYGVAYKIESAELKALHHKFKNYFNAILIPQDKQGFRPHITIQNKVNPTNALQLYQKLSKEFLPMVLQAEGLDLWRYLKGPWQHVKYYNFLPK